MTNQLPRVPRLREILARALAAVALGAMSLGMLVATAAPAHAVTAVALSVSPSSGKPGQSVFMAATAIGPNCDGRQVTFSLGSRSTTRTTNKNCFASATLTVPLVKPCPASVSARASVAGAFDRSSFTVKCAPDPKPTTKPKPKPKPTASASPTPKPEPKPTKKPKPKPTKKPKPKPTPSPTLSPTTAPEPEPTRSELLPLVPVDDGGPRPGASQEGSTAFSDPAALGVVLLGGLTALLLALRPQRRPELIGVVAAVTVALAAGLVALPEALVGGSPPPEGMKLSVVRTQAAPGTAVALALCPPGSAPVGGGASTKARDGTPTVLTRSQPTAQGWQAEVASGQDTEADLTAVAVCAEMTAFAAQLETSEQVALAPGATGRFSPRCSAGQPLAMGWDAGTARAVSALPLAQGGAFAVRAGGLATSARGYLLCADADSGTAITRYRGSTKSIVGGKERTASALCPAGQQPVGGGFVATSGLGGRLAEVSIRSAAPADNRYTVAAAAPPRGADVQLTVYALCVPSP